MVELKSTETPLVAEKKSGSKTGLYIFVGLLLAIGIGVLLYFLVFKKKDDKKPEIDPNVPPVIDGKSYRISDAVSKMCLSFDVKTRRLVAKTCDASDPGQKFTAVRVSPTGSSWWLRNTQQADKIAGDNLPAGQKTFCMTLNSAPNRRDTWNLGVECDPWKDKPDTHWLFSHAKEGVTGENWSMSTEQAWSGVPNEKTDTAGPPKACLLYDSTGQKLTFAGNCASQNWVFTPII